DAIALARRGGAPMSPGIARLTVGFFQQLRLGKAGPVELTPREGEILEHLSTGLSYKAVAERLGVGLDATRSHIKQIYRKLEAHSREEAVRHVNEALSPDRRDKRKS